MQELPTLEQRLAGYVASPPRRLRRARLPHRSRRPARTHRPPARVGVRIFEIDRLLYDIEVEAQQAWLRRLVAFDAYCARRDAAR